MSAAAARRAYNVELKAAIAQVAISHPEINLAEMERQLHPMFEGRMPARPTLARVMIGMGWTRAPDDSCAGAYFVAPTS